MHRSINVGLIVTAAILLVAGSVESATRPKFPPAFRESVDTANLKPRVDLNYRLPNNTVPQHYDIVLTTKVDEGIRDFNGIVTIDLTVVEETNFIILYARQLNFTSATMQSGTAAPEELNIEYEEQREFLTVTRKVATPFPKDTKWKLTVVYYGLLRSDNAGFYMTTYTDVDGNERTLAATQFESTNARHAFPCYDDPGKRATFTVTINHSPSYTAISNMPVDETVSVAGSGKTVFQQTMNMSTYLVAFIISDFKYSEGVLNGLTQRVYSRPGSEHEQEWGLLSGMLITQRLAEYFGVNFMLPKLDQAAIPNKGGAMENWGMATYGEQYMLYNRDTSTVYRQTDIANIIAHEYCHQWFGDYVTIEWWTYLWLKEGFAQMFSFKATDDAYPEWGIWQQFHVDDYQTSMVDDADDNPIPMTHYVQTPAEISGRYSHVSYSKAGSVLHMWNHALTDKVFQRGLHNYLDSNKFTAAIEDKLFQALQIAAEEEKYSIPASIADMLGSWTHQGGFPLLTVTRNYEDGSFTVTQEAFFNNENTKAEKLWYIPVNYAVKSKADFRDTEASHYLVNVPSIRVDNKLSNDDWLILNKQSTGYYRINYDERNWKLIIDGLISHPYRIHPRNRAQLMHDAYRFSISNRLSHSILLEMLTYLVNEDQYAPWSTANGIINTYTRYLSGDSNYQDFKHFISEIVRPIYEKLGLNDIPGEQHYQKYTRNVIIHMACLAGLDICLQETNDKLQALVQSNIVLEPNVEAQIYCNGLRQSGDLEFNYVFDKLMATNEQTLRNTLISSLGCAQKESHLQTFVASSTNQNNNLRSQERTIILSAAYSRGQSGLYASIDFLETKWQAYGDLGAGSNCNNNPLGIAIRGMSSYVVNSEQETKLLALVEKVKGSVYVSSNLETAVQTNIQSNYDWLKLHREPLMSWLTKYRTGGSSSITLSSVTIVSVVVLAVSRLF